MGYWNHRVVKRTYQSGEDEYSIREVYYNDDDTIYAYSLDSRQAYGETLEELKVVLERMLRCLDKPVLIEDEIECIDKGEAL